MTRNLNNNHGTSRKLWLFPASCFGLRPHNSFVIPRTVAGNEVGRGEGTCPTSHSRLAAERKPGLRPLSPAWGSIHHTQHKFLLKATVEAHGKMLHTSVVRETQMQNYFSASHSLAEVPGRSHRTGWPDRMAENRDNEETELARLWASQWACLMVQPLSKNGSAVSYDANYTLTVQPSTACKYEWSIGKEWERGAVTSV